jgi:anaerobic dimethyl sulfoxide reductase subunit A
LIRFKKHPLTILIVVKPGALCDSLVQVLSQLPFQKHFLSASCPAELISGLEDQPELIVAAPFTLSGKIQDYEVLRHRVKASPLVIVLPEDTRDYRDAAVLLGANSIVLAARIAENLIPTVKRLLSRKRLVSGVAGQIVSKAHTCAPAGESCYGTSTYAREIQQLSNRAVERLATQVTPTELNGAENTRRSASGAQVYLKGLKLSAASPTNPLDQRSMRTACNLNCGAHFCGLKVTVRGEHITKIEPADFPDDRYRRICLKGISHVQMEAHPDRLLYPLKRHGHRGSGEWDRISWKQALDEIAARTKELSANYGPQSIMFFPYSGQLSVLNGISGVYLRLASALRASGTSLNEYGVDSAVPSGIEDTFGKGSGYLANDFADLPNSRLVLIWGADPVQSHMNWWPFFLEAKRGGTKLVTIDPRFTTTAAKSDEWIAVRPGTDLYLALALLNVIIESDWIDWEFTLRHTVAPLLVRQDTGAYLRCTKCDPEDSPFRVWDKQAQETVAPGQAVQPALHGHFKVRGVDCRPAFDLLCEMAAQYTPDLAAQKTGVPTDRIRVLANAIAHDKPARIFSLYGIDRWHNGATFGRLIAILAALTGNLGKPGAGAGVDGFASPILLASDALMYPDGLKYEPINVAELPHYILEEKPYPIKGLFAAFSNWINQWPDQNFLRERILPKLDLLVVADHFMTETARWADYVLPAASLFEREDMVIGPGPYIQYQPQIIDSPGECRSDLQIASDLAERLDCGQYFSKTAEDYLSMIFDTEQMLDGLSFNELRKNGLLQRNVSDAALVVHQDYKFDTPTRRVEFYVERLLPYNHALPEYEPPAEADLDGKLIEKYPLVCLTEHSRYRVHSTFVNAPWLRELDQEPYAIVHPDTARPRAIQDGDLVRLFNDRGFVVLRAHVNQAVPSNAVYLSQGWQSGDYRAGHAQTLTHSIANEKNAYGANSSFSDVLVEMVKVTKGEIQ